MKIKSDSNRAKLQSKHFGCNHRRLPSGLPSKLGAGRANTRDYIANRCVLLKYASASRVAEGARGLAHGAFCTRGTMNELEALPAELGFADTLISVEFPALKRNQARSLEGSVGAGKRGGRGEPWLAVPIQQCWGARKRLQEPKLRGCMAPQPSVGKGLVPEGCWWEPGDSQDKGTTRV